MTVARCEFTDLFVDSCAHCTGRDGGEQAERERRARLLDQPNVHAARYPGACCDCGEWFQAGEPILLTEPYEPYAGEVQAKWRASCCIEATL